MLSEISRGPADVVAEIGDLIAGFLDQTNRCICCIFGAVG